MSVFDRETAVPTPKIAVVDERGENAAAYRRVVSLFVGAVPSCFTDPERALSWCQRERADIVIFDYPLLRMDGFEFARRFRAMGRPDAVIVMLTGKAQPGLRHAAHRAGIDLVLVKPVRPDQFYMQVERAVAARERLAARMARVQTIKMQARAGRPPALWGRARVAATGLGILALSILAWFFFNHLGRLHSGASPVTGPGHAIAHATGPGSVPGRPGHSGDGNGQARPGANGSGIAAPGASVATAPGAAAQATATAPAPSGGWRNDNPSAGTGVATHGLAGPPGAAQRSQASGGELSDRQRAAAKAALNPLAAGGAGFLVLDGDGNEVDGHDADVPAVPASTVKVLTAMAALATLGPGYRFHTILKALGPVHGTQIDGALALVGSGDPTLTSSDLDAAAAALARLGIRRVAGGLLVDATAFTLPERNARWPRADSAFAYGAGVSAVSVDGGLHDGRPVDDLRRYSGDVLSQRLAAHGIAVTGATHYGPAGSGEVLWDHESAPLASLIRPMLVTSDNHTAEQLLRAVGVRASGDGSERGGVEAIAAYLAAHGVPADGLRLYDGSGLSPDDRMTPRTLATALKAVETTPEGPQIALDLPIVGRDLDVQDHRLTAARGLVRAKAGHLAGARALAGYVQSQGHGNVAFAIMASGPQSVTAEYRATEDAALDRLASAAP